MPLWRILVFLAVLTTVTGGVHYYLWNRLVKSPAWPAPWMNVATWLIVGLAVTIPVGLIGARLFGRDMLSPLVWTGYIWMGSMFLCFVLLLPTELIRAGFHFFGREDGVVDPVRRQLLSRIVAGGVVTVGAGLSGLGLVTALRKVAIKEVRVPIAGLDARLSGLRVVQLTDIHVGPTIGRAFIEQLVDSTNALEPDIVAITGDLVDGSVEELGEAVRPLGNLRARHGVFFVTGNHEYYSGADEWAEFVGSLGITVLRNERVSIEHDGAALDVAGVNDWNAGQFDDGPDLRKALDGRPDGRPVLLLAHQPRQIEEAAAQDVSLMLSGHTHGGQIFPFNFLVRLQQPYVAGLHDHGGTKLYVSSGTGYWGPPMRVGIPAEITDLRLDAA
ncbi:MAG: metallophosphoesterase [Sandaracinaceae bacterium]